MTLRVRAVAIAVLMLAMCSTQPAHAATGQPTVSDDPSVTTSPLNGQSLGAERVVLHTDAGDVVVALYSQTAPKNVAQFLRLAQTGLLATTDFFRIEPHFVVQVDVRQRATAATAEQTKALVDVPRELAADVHHVRGVLSMAHYDNRPDSGGTSFSVVLGDSPHLDGQYTVFGEVVHGMDVVDAIAGVPLDGNRPRPRIAITSAEVVATAGSLGSLRPAVALPTASIDSGLHPRIVLSTPAGDVLIALAPAEAPKHVASLQAAVKAGALTTCPVAATRTDFYVQCSAPVSSGLSALAHEQPITGNVTGAVSIYDGGGGNQQAALIILLANSPQLNDTYTPVGWVESGLDVIRNLANRPTSADHVPKTALSLGPARAVDASQPIILRNSGRSTSAGGSGLASGALAAVAALITLAIAAGQRRWTPRQTSSLALAAVLVGFFAVWVGLASATSTRPWLGTALFATALAIFKLMGRFETPIPPSKPEPAAEASLSVRTSSAVSPVASAE